MAKHKIFFFLLGDSSPSNDMFPITVSPNTFVGELKDEVYAKTANSLKGIDARMLRLWKLNNPIPPTEAEANAGVDALCPKGLKLSEFAIQMGASMKLEFYFPLAVEDGSIQVIIQPPDSGQRRGPPHNDTEGELASEGMIRSGSGAGAESVAIHPEWSERRETVSGILELLHKYRLVQVRGTPASGKTTLMHLLDAHIMKTDPDAEVFIQTAWPKELLKENEHRIKENLPGYPSFGPKDKKRYFLFDEGQSSYWDTFLWMALKNTIQGSSQSVYVYAVIFCSFGNEDVTEAAVATPADFGLGKVTLNRANKALSKPCGLLLDQAEFFDLIHLRPNIRLTDQLHDFVYSFTQGHVGAIIAVLDFLLKKRGPSMLRGVIYTLEQFQQDTASFDELCEHLSADRGIRRGMPKKPAHYGQAMRALLLDGSIHSDNQEIAEDTRQMLSKGYHLGFINLDDSYQYTFASPLHQQLWSWYLLPQKDYRLPYLDLVSFMTDTVSRFRPSQLDSIDRRVGSASHRPPEAQYQEEYYRCVHIVTSGNVRISPEYAAAAGSRPGRIDFFIPCKKWGIELTRDGRDLKGHSLRFANDGAYGQWLESSKMVDYVLLDFRHTVPQQPHPGIPNLYHIVFDEGNTQVEVYDKHLRLITKENLMQM